MVGSTGGDFSQAHPIPDLHFQDVLALNVLNSASPPISTLVDRIFKSDALIIPSRLRSLADCGLHIPLQVMWLVVGFVSVFLDVPFYVCNYSVVSFNSTCVRTVTYSHLCIFFPCFFLLLSWILWEVLRFLDVHSLQSLFQICISRFHVSSTAVFLICGATFRDKVILFRITLSHSSLWMYWT
ncbi:hypothetical protein PUN28_020459 [Cardiocondyla obscurior]|uniref:Uncharacterized protein n=1 Tax=Cardiocondyla obscurior TaxID=286306 RepID=A0AAW2E4C2_9HYME